MCTVQFLKLNWLLLLDVVESIVSFVLCDTRVLNILKGLSWDSRVVSYYWEFVQYITRGSAYTTGIVAKCPDLAGIVPEFGPMSRFA